MLLLLLQGARVLEGLAASGLRSIRYALELDGVSRIDANDLDPSVVESMKQNISFNGPDAEAKVQPTCSDARLLMLQSPGVSLLRLLGPAETRIRPTNNGFVQSSSQHTSHSMRRMLKPGFSQRAAMHGCQCCKVLG
eukprot:GHUV01039322.1.p1 GENE.GHUV01039322.1~~GHUV01039322.1.p1  ORF type:complete len:137 (+),score=15.08 GHUV01039322.1:1054-1464(+)